MNPHLEEGVLHPATGAALELVIRIWQDGGRSDAGVRFVVERAGGQVIRDGRI